LASAIAGLFYSSDHRDLLHVILVDYEGVGDEGAVAVEAGHLSQKKLLDAVRTHLDVHRELVDTNITFLSTDEYRARIGEAQ
jgi:hypothetical protein